MNLVQKFSSLFLLFSIASVQARLEGAGIIGGDMAAEGQYGYQVALLLNGKSFCGGGIINDHYVVTAAHCLIDSTNRWRYLPSMQVIAGTTDLRSSPNSKVIVDVEDIFVPAEFNGSGSLTSTTGDIAVLKLKQSLHIDDNPNLRKLKLPDEKENFDRVKAVVTGFGWSKVFLKFDPNFGAAIANHGDTDNRMRYAYALVMDYKSCHIKQGATTKHLCAVVDQRSATKDEGICKGDSGGPLVYNNTIIGVVSSVPLTCSEKYYIPSVYTRVSSFVNFIKIVMDGKIDGNVCYLKPVTQSSFWSNTLQFLGIQP